MGRVGLVKTASRHCEQSETLAQRPKNNGF